MDSKTIITTRDTAKALVENTKSATGKDLYREVLQDVDPLDLKRMTILVERFDPNLTPERFEMLKILARWRDAKSEDMLWVVMVAGAVARL